MAMIGSKQMVLLDCLWYLLSSTSILIDSQQPLSFAKITFVISAAKRASRRPSIKSVLSFIANSTAGRRGQMFQYCISYKPDDITIQSAFWSHLGLHVMTVYLVFLVAVLSVSLSQPPSPSCHCQGTVGTDFTLDPDEIGPEVVLATVAKIRRSDVFDNDFGFLRRMAAVETDDGSMLGMNGGIWDISRVTYISVNGEMTMGEDGMALSQQLEEHFCISWSSNVSDYDAINVPLFSALTAMARLRLRNRTIPDDIQGQANLWRDVFERSGDPQDFIDIAQTLADEGKL